MNFLLILSNTYFFFLLLFSSCCNSLTFLDFSRLVPFIELGLRNIAAASLPGLKADDITGKIPPGVTGISTSKDLTIKYMF